MIRVTTVAALTYHFLTSVSHEMKRKLLPMFNCVPFLIEYCSTPEEESEIDLLQARKCTDFKRMMLESVKQGGGVGIPIPIGYDDIQVFFFYLDACHTSGVTSVALTVQDIESWPMLQAFALDHVYCPTGFFTARYNVADITTHLEVQHSSAELRSLCAYLLTFATLRTPRFCSVRWTGTTSKTRFER